MSRTPARGYRPDIDGLRAIAVTSVVFFHAFPQRLSGGFVGVDIFFAISGYLISQHIIETLHEGRFSLVDFYARRIKRIYPALIFVLIVSLAAGMALMTSGELEQLAREALAGVAFIANVYFYFTRDYFSQDAAASPLLHLWSLGVEEQFYIVWPVGLYLVWRFTSRRVATALIFTALLISLAGSACLSRSHAVAAFYLPMARFWELLLGSMLAWGEFHLRKRSEPSGASWLERWRDLASFAGLALIVAGLVLLDPKSVFPGWRAALPAGGATLVIAGGMNAWLNRRVLSTRALIYIGLLSYPLYLWHWPILVFVRLLTGGAPSTEVLLVAIAAAFGLSSMTCRFVEMPARFSMVARRYPLRVASMLVVMMMGVGASSFAISSDGGLPDRFPDARFGGSEEHWFFSTACQKQFPGSEFCMMPEADGHPEVALLGDSHANHYYEGLAGALATSGTTLFAVGSGNCPPFYDVDISLGGHAKSCSALFDGALDYVVKSPNIRWVVLSSYAISSIAGGLDYGTGDYIRLAPAHLPASDAVNDAANDASNLSVYLSGLNRTLDRLTAAGKHVVVVLDTPELDFDPSACVRRPGKFPVRSPCAVPRAKVEQRLEASQESILALLRSYPDVKVFNPMSTLCDQRNCYARRNGEFLYADRDHLAPGGSRFLSKGLMKDIESWGALNVAMR